MTPPAPVPQIVNGWVLLTHPVFSQQLAELESEVARLRARDPVGYSRKNAAKRYAAILRLTRAVIPQDPAREEFRLGTTLGPEHRHWRRAKFFQQYRLFFRYHTGLRIIVYAWVNDPDTLRAYDSSDDAYRVFRRMLGRGRPPDDWDALLAESR